MATASKENVSYQLLGMLSNLVICSCCLRDGTVTPVPQIISERHSLTNQCAECRSRNARRFGSRRKMAKLLPLQDQL